MMSDIVRGAAGLLEKARPTYDRAAAYARGAMGRGRAEERTPDMFGGDPVQNAFEAGNRHIGERVRGISDAVADRPLASAGVGAAVAGAGALGGMGLADLSNVSVEELYDVLDDPESTEEEKYEAMMLLQQLIRGV